MKAKFLDYTVEEENGEVVYNYVMESDNGVAVVSVRNEDYINEFFLPHFNASTMDEVAEILAGKDEVEVYLNERESGAVYASFFQGGGAFAPKSKDIGTPGKSYEKIIIDVKTDDSAISLILDDDSIIKKSWSVKIGERYLPDMAKKTRVMRSLGFKGDVNVVDTDGLIGKTISYYVNKLKFSPFTAFADNIVIE